MEMMKQRTIESENYAKREVVGEGRSGKTAIWNTNGDMGDFNLTAPATPAAQQWAGWGTALKPAHEPICMARKPFRGTVADNVLEWGVGGINVDGCRVGMEKRPLMVRTETVVAASSMAGKSTGATASGEMTAQGRWPANIILSYPEDVYQLRDDVTPDQLRVLARWLDANS